MNHDDPFTSPDTGEQTVIKPTPGGRRPGPGPAPPPAGSGTAMPLPARSAALNPLEDAATALLDLMVRLKNTSFHPNPGALRRQVIAEIKAFEARARASGISPETVLGARYVLGTALDEVVLNTPWGSASDWSKQSLLSTFHNETWGGEKFFLLLDRLNQDPAGNLHLLELMYLCLALGFEGRYHVMEDGRSRVEEIRERLYRTIRTQRGGFERELSPHWRGVVERRNPLTRFVPLWVALALASVLLLGVFISLSWLLNRASDPVFAALHEVGREGTTLVRTELQPPEPLPQPLHTPPSPPLPPCLSDLLAEEIRQGLLEVLEQEGQTTIRIRGDGLFASASTRVKDDYQPVLLRIAEALKKVPGQVLVTGHADNIPIFTPRFPSNWHLSQERADAVTAILAEYTGTTGRFESEGRSDTEPLVPNDSPANRARNRRVEITLFTEGCNGA